MAAVFGGRITRLLSINSLQVRAISTCQIKLSASKILPHDDERVKSILKRLTGCDVDKVFARQLKRQKAKVPSYKLMTDEELLEAENLSKQKAEEILEMPPIMEERKDADLTAIDFDDRLSGYDTADYVFTDISPSSDDKNRSIVIREPSGRLRSATWSERDMYNFIYFPKDGRQWEMPEMLTESGIEVPLSLNRHEDILDLVCVQCEPDSSDYIRVHQTVYEDIEKCGKHDLLWSTRHFGGLVYYLMRHRRLDSLMDYYTCRDMFDEAVDVVKLHNLAYPNHKVTKEAIELQLDGIYLLKAYLKSEGPVSALHLVEENLNVTEEVKEEMKEEMKESAENKGSKLFS